MCTSNELAELLGAYTLDDEIHAVDFGLQDEDDEDDYRSDYMRRRRRLGGPHDEEAERVLAEIRANLCAFITNAINSWSVPQTSPVSMSDDHSSSATLATSRGNSGYATDRVGGFTSLSDEIGEPARRRQRRSDHPLAALRASTPEIGLPETPMALRIAFARGEHVYAATASATPSPQHNEIVVSSRHRRSEDDDDRMDDDDDDDESPPRSNRIAQSQRVRHLQEEDQDHQEPARQRCRRSGVDGDEVDEDCERRRAPKQQRHDSHDGDENEVAVAPVGTTTNYVKQHRPCDHPREEDSLVATLFVAMQDRSPSNAIDVNAVVGTFSKPKSHRRQFVIATSPFAPPPTPPASHCGMSGEDEIDDEDDATPFDSSSGPAWLSRAAARRLFFEAMDQNRSNVAHFEEFARVMRCACGTYSEAAIGEERQLCLNVLQIEPGSLRACVEDALYVRLRVARPADPQTERRVASRYLNSQRHFFNADRTTLASGQEFRALPHQWFRHWLAWSNLDDGHLGEDMMAAGHHHLRRPPPIDVSSLVRTNCAASQRVLRTVEAASNSAVVPTGRGTAQPNRCAVVAPAGAHDEDIDEDARAIRTDDDDDDDADTGLMDGRAMALEETAILHQDFELVSVTLYDALAAWHMSRGPSLSRVAAGPAGDPAVLDLHPPRCFAQNKKDGLVVVPCWKHERLEEVAKRAFDAFAQRTDDRINSSGRAPGTARRSRRRQQAFPPVNVATTRDRLRILLVRTMRRRRLVPIPLQQQPGSVEPSDLESVSLSAAQHQTDDELIIHKLALVYDGPPFARAAARSPLGSLREPTTSAAWTTTIGELLQHCLAAPANNEGEEMLPRDISIELKFEDEDDEDQGIVTNPVSTAEQASPVGQSSQQSVINPALPGADSSLLKGEVGLRNLGNTCYMNAVIQALAHVPPLREYFTSGEFGYDINLCSKFGAKGALAAAFGQLLHQLSSSETEAITPDAFKRTLSQWDGMFAGYAQQDASEFLIKLFEGIGEDLNRITNKPYLENPDVTSEGTDQDSPTSPARTVEIETIVANECWKNHAKLREDHPITALFGGQSRREIYCNKNQRERSVGFDAFSSLTVPLYDTETTNANSSEELVDVRVRIRFARSRIWPLDAVARVSADANIADVLAECAKLRLTSDAILNSPELSDDRYYSNRIQVEPVNSNQAVDDHHGVGDKRDQHNGEVSRNRRALEYIAPLRSETLVAMLPPMIAAPTANDKALEVTSRLLMPNVRIRESPITVVYAATHAQRLEIFETVPEMPIFGPDDSEALKFQAKRSVYVCAALRTLVEVDSYFVEPSRLAFFGDPFVVRVIAGVTTGAMLRCQIWEHVRPWMNSVPYDDHRDRPNPIFDVRIFPPRGSERERAASNTLATSEMLLPGGGRVIQNNDNVIVRRVQDLDGCYLVVDVPRSARQRFNERSMSFSMIHESCAPPPPKPPIALSACIKSYCAPETVTKYSKSETKRNNGEYTEAEHTATVSIWRPPPFLALILKRFMVTERGRKRKLSERVAFPIEGLDLTEFCSRPQRKQARQEDGKTHLDEDDDDNVLPIYDLVSVVNHFGGLEHGHYTCAARRLDNSGWLEFDDKRVEKLDIGELCDDPAAYVLVYARRDTFEGPNPLGYLRRRFARVHDVKIDVDAILRPAPQPPQLQQQHQGTPLLTAGPVQSSLERESDIADPPATPHGPVSQQRALAPQAIVAHHQVRGSAEQEYHEFRANLHPIGGPVNGNLLGAASPRQIVVNQQHAQVVPIGTEQPQQHIVASSTPFRPSNHNHLSNLPANNGPSNLAAPGGITAKGVPFVPPETSLNGDHAACVRAPMTVPQRSVNSRRRGPEEDDDDENRHPDDDDDRLGAHSRTGKSLLHTQKRIAPSSQRDGGSGASYGGMEHSGAPLAPRRPDDNKHAFNPAQDDFYTSRESEVESRDARMAHDSSHF